MRKTGVIVVAVVLFLGLATYIAVPPILRHVLTGSVATSIHRQVSVGKIRFNLYRLKLDLDQLHVGERDDPQKPFVDLGHLTVKVSWTSLFRLAPVVGEVVIDKPAIHVVRESAAEIQFFRFARERACSGETETRGAQLPATICGVEYSTARR